MFLYAENKEDSVYVGKYLDDLKKRDLVKIGIELGLDYNRLDSIAEHEFPHEMVRIWLLKVDNVVKFSGTPTLNSLARALKAKGFTGHADKISRRNIDTSKSCLYNQCFIWTPKMIHPKLNAKNILPKKSSGETTPLSTTTPDAFHHQYVEGTTSHAKH